MELDLSISEDVLQQSISERIRTIRMARGITAPDLADRIGVSRPSLWAWENGKAYPRDDNRNALAEALKVPAELFELHASTRNLDNSLLQIIADAKNRIARIAGVPHEKVVITIEF